MIMKLYCPCFGAEITAGQQECLNYYFLSEDGTVYSRYSHETLADKEEAYNEFFRIFMGYDE